MAILKSGSVRKKWKFRQNLDQKFKSLDQKFKSLDQKFKKSLARRKWKVDLTKVRHDW